MTGRTARPDILFVAPVRAELSGRAMVSAQLLRRLPQDAVTVYDTSPSPRRVPGPIGSILRRGRELCALARFASFAVRERGRATVSYVSGNADPGVLVTLAFVGLSRLAQVRLIAVHHHSSWLARSGVLIRVFHLVGGNAMVHLVLCKAMARQMQAAAPQSSGRVRVLGNGWIREAVSPARTHSPSALRLGFLGRFEADKGWDRALDVFTRISRVRETTMEVAGIPQDEAHAAQVRARVNGAGATFLGPVFGPEKGAFFGRVDVVLFPSTYRNEAYPVAVFEALSHGCVVAAIDIGCLSEMVGGAGIVTSRDDFEDRAAAFLTEVAPGTNLAQSAFDRATRLRQESDIELREILREWDVTVP